MLSSAPSSSSKRRAMDMASVTAFHAQHNAAMRAREVYYNAASTSPPPSSSSPLSVLPGSPPQLPGLSQLLHKRERLAEDVDAPQPRRKRLHALAQSLRPPESTSRSSPSSSDRDSFPSTASDSTVAAITPQLSMPRPSVQRVRSDSTTSDSTDSVSPHAGFSSSGGGVYPRARTLAKSSRYLREIDRRNILQRIENGEKQAALAKEYQVSRAAICNLNKHRELVLSRKDENPLAKHPKKPRPRCIGTAQRLRVSSRASDLVNGSTSMYEVKSRPVQLLLTKLRDQGTSTSDFKRYGDRLLRLLVEEALSCAPFKNVPIVADGDNGSIKIDGVKLERPPCAIALEATEGSSLLRVFHVLEPQCPTGHIRLEGDDEVDDFHLPRNVQDHSVFLLDLESHSSEKLCQALRLLLSCGVEETAIWLVSLSVTMHAVEIVHAAFPGVKVVTADIDHAGTSNQSDLKSQVLLRRLRQFYDC